MTTKEHLSDADEYEDDVIVITAQPRQLRSSGQPKPQRKKRQHPDDELDIRYTNVEGEAIGWIYEADLGDHDGLVMNPAGFLHQGTALRDCLKTVSLPYVEVHMTNIEKRDFRSVTASVADTMVAGLGVQSYVLGLAALRTILSR